MLEAVIWAIAGAGIGLVGYLVYAKVRGLAPFHRPRFNLAEGMNDHRYRCVGCKKEFTLHDLQDDPYEYDPACPWCEDVTGLPCYVPPVSASNGDKWLASMQTGLMESMKPQPVKADDCDHGRGAAVHEETGICLKCGSKLQQPKDGESK